MYYLVHCIILFKASSWSPQCSYNFFWSYTVYIELMRSTLSLNPCYLNKTLFSGNKRQIQSRFKWIRLKLYHSRFFHFPHDPYLIWFDNKINIICQVGFLCCICYCLSFNSSYIISHLDYDSNPSDPSALVCLYIHSTMNIYTTVMCLKHRFDIFLLFESLLCLTDSLHVSKCRTFIHSTNYPWQIIPEHMNGSQPWAAGFFTFMRKNLNKVHSMNPDLYKHVWWMRGPHSNLILGNN